MRAHLSLSLYVFDPGASRNSECGRAEREGDTFLDGPRSFAGFVLERDFFFVQ